MKAVYSQTARRDLRDIYEYIAFSLLSPETARSVSERLMGEIRSLETMPERCPLFREEPWRSRGVRFLPVKKYLIFYIADRETDTVLVLRIVYGGRDLPRLLAEAIPETETGGGDDD